MRQGFVGFVEFLVAIGVVIAAVSNYLIINKLWKRKEVKEVAESISIGAALLGLFTSIPLFIQLAMIDATPLPAAKTAISIATGFVFVALGSGLWVPELRDQGFGRLFLRALNLERRESGYLLKTLVQPRGAERILEILEGLAAVDREVDPREIELIREFARRWKLEPPTLESGRTDRDDGLLGIRQSVVAYLALEPPREEASQLLDLLGLFVQADADVSEAEELVLEEATGLVRAYVDREGAEEAGYEVLIVPQSEAQFDAVRSLIPGAEPKVVRGGQVVSVGRFFSARYAEAVCERYIALGLFTTPVVA